MSALERFRGFRDRVARLGPEALHLDVTNACNLDCVTCWSYAPDLTTPKTAEWKRRRLELPVARGVLDEAVALRVERVVLAGGGEPFTHPDIDALIEAVKARGLKLTLITNGTRCDFDRLAAVGVDQLLLNVASATPATYATYHPSQPEQTFHRLMQGALRLKGSVKVNFVQVINAVNAHELVQMVELAHAHGARCSFKVGDLPAGTERYALGAEQRDELASVLIPAAWRRAEALGVRHNLDAYQAALLGHERGLPRCFAGHFYARVSVDGRVQFCCAPIEVGRLPGFAELWAGPRYQALRERLARNEYLEPCRRCGKYDMNFALERELEALRAAGLV